MPAHRSVANAIKSGTSRLMTIDFCELFLLRELVVLTPRPTEPPIQPFSDSRHDVSSKNVICILHFQFGPPQWFYAHA